MPEASGDLTDLEARIASGEGYGRADAERILTCRDLPGIGALGEGLRRAWRGDQVTYGRVCEMREVAPDTIGDAGELRLVGAPDSADAARALVREAAARSGGVPVTGFSLPDLRSLVGGDYLALAELAAALRADGLEAVAEVPVDRLGELQEAIDALHAVARGGLGAWRATVQDAPPAARLEVIIRAAELQGHTAAFRAFAPLPRSEPADAPSTGYDDVRTITMARMLCRTIPSVQVDWLLHGPKLAQVAIAYGADDLDAVPADDPLQLGRRRAPREDVERQVRAAFAVPVARNGRYELLP